MNPIVKVLIAAESVILSPNPSREAITAAVSSVAQLGDPRLVAKIQHMLDERFLHKKGQPKLPQPRVIPATPEQHADAYRALRHPDPAEHILAQSMPGFSAEHVSWAIHNKDHSGRPVIDNLDPKRFLSVMNDAAWTDFLTNAHLSRVVALVSDPEGLASLTQFLGEARVSEALIGRLLSEEPGEAQDLADAVLPACSPDLIKSVFRRAAAVSPNDTPVERNRLLTLITSSSPQIQALIPGDVFQQFWETLVVPNRAFNWLPASAPLLPVDQEAMLADFDKTRDPEALTHLARMKALGPSAVKGVLDRLVKLPADLRRQIAHDLSGNGHVSRHEADAHALLASTHLAKTEAVQDGIRRLPPGLYRLYRVACSVFAVWPEEDEAEVLKLRSAAWANDGELIATALAAVGQPNTDENRTVLRAAADMMPLVKSERPVPANAPVKALSSSAFDVAEDIAQHLESTRAAHLDGKHSKGSFFVDTTSAVWFMKPGTGGTGPIEGMKDDPAPASAREAAYWAIAQDWGLGDNTTRAEWVSVDGKLYAAIKFLPADYKPVIDEMEEHPGRVSAALDSYRQRGRLWQWAVLDWVTGNGDRHGHNMLINDEGDIRLIDHGSAFAGVHFNPAHDCESFTPYYLRYTTPKDVVFNTLKPSEKLGYMPDLPMSAQNRLRGWLMSLDSSQLERNLERFGIEPGPSLHRLKQVQQVGSDLAGFVNRIWAGF